MNRNSRTGPYITRYGKSINYKKKKARDFNNDYETTKSFRERNSTFIFGEKER
jgi:hypothetical protein